MKITNNMVVRGTFIVAKNVRVENNELVADGIYNNYIDENGDCQKEVQYIITEDGDAVKLV